MEKDNNQEQIKQMMLKIYSQFQSRGENEDSEISEMIYYKNFQFRDAGFEEHEVYVTKIEKDEEKQALYEIYKGGALIANVDEQGKIHFAPEYLEAIKGMSPGIFEQLNLEDAEFELPKELGDKDVTMQKEEIEEEGVNEKIRYYDSKKENLEEKENENEEQENKQEEQKSVKGAEEQQQEEIATKKGIPSSNILIVRENSNFYYDHPNLEKNLYFYRDNDGVVKAEYIDENGIAQPSKYFGDSKTLMTKNDVDLGKGDSVKEGSPYQVMQTKNLNGVDQDIKGIRICVYIDTYGYLQLKESRRGSNGEWESHDIEVKGRDYNSHEVNEATSIRTRKADPNEQTEAYEDVEATGLAKDGIQYDEMYLINHPEEIIEGLIKEGYQRDEAIKIFDYVVGEEKLTMDEAKERVNEEIEEKSKDSEDYGENEGEGYMPWTVSNVKKYGIDDEEYGPWSAAEARRMR